VSKSAQWQEIMAGLRGRRLAVYDDILNRRLVERCAPEVQNILGWLAYNQFLARGEDGTMRARTVAEARERWAAEGSARDAAAVAAAPRQQTTDQRPQADTAPAERPVHAAKAYTPELFP
jgi:hypothetical protein